MNNELRKVTNRIISFKEAKAIIEANVEGPVAARSWDALIQIANELITANDKARLKRRAERKAEREAFAKSVNAGDRFEKNGVIYELVGLALGNAFNPVVVVKVNDDDSVWGVGDKTTLSLSELMEARRLPDCDIAHVTTMPNRYIFQFNDFVGSWMWVSFDGEFIDGTFKEDSEPHRQRMNLVNIYLNK